MFWAALIAIIAGVLIQEKTEHKKIGKALWIFGAILLGIIVILIILIFVFGIGMGIDLLGNQ